MKAYTGVGSRWYLYHTAPTDEIAEKYITGEIEDLLRMVGGPDKAQEKLEELLNTNRHC